MAICVHHWMARDEKAHTGIVGPDVLVTHLTCIRCGMIKRMTFVRSSHPRVSDAAKAVAYKATRVDA